jgi:hypothetical protein
MSRATSRGHTVTISKEGYTAEDLRRYQLHLSERGVSRIWELRLLMERMRGG